MKQRPILFRDELVRAILDGRKRQTRRLVGLPSLRRSETPGYDWTFRGRAPIRSVAQQQRHPGGCWQDVGHDRLVALCPYGVPGDLLWVRECWGASSWYDGTAPRDIHPGAGVAYRATGGVAGVKLRPSIHMPRWAARLFLRVTDVRVERLQDISDEDARAEGVKARDAAIVFQNDADGRPRLTAELHGTARSAFACLWDSLAKPGSMWPDNPWVWVVNFERASDEREVGRG